MNESINVPYTVIIPGLACNERSSVLIPLAKKAMESRGVETYCLDGIAQIDSHIPRAKTPQELFDEVVSIAEEKGRPPLAISHCLGALSLVKSMQKYPEMQGILISPPLGYPYDIMTHPSVLTREKKVGGRAIAQAKYFDPQYPYNFSRLTPIDVALEDDYFDQVHDANNLFPDVVQDLHASGRLGLVIPENDWNRSAAPLVKGWTGKSLLLPGAKHSLNTQNDPNLAQQISNVSTSIDFALFKM